jgi:hypothetical protein
MENPMRSSLRQASAELRLRHRVVSSVYLHLTDLCACVMVRLNIGLSLGHLCDLSLFNRRYTLGSAHMGELIEKGRFIPSGLRKRLEADRAEAGLSKWPSNALRHSFGSYHLEHFENAARTAVGMGHRNQDLLLPRTAN